MVGHEFRLSNCVVALPNLDFHDHFVSVVNNLLISVTDSQLIFM